MSIQKLGTKFTTGAWLINVKEYFKKINEIIDYLNGISGAGSYKSYVATLTQTSTNAPIPTVISNTLSGTPVWSYTAQGIYTVTLTGAFTVGKTFVVKAALPGITQQDFSGNTTSALVSHTIIDVNSISIATFPNTSAPEDAWLSDYPIEIRVYN